MQKEIRVDNIGKKIRMKIEIKKNVIFWTKKLKIIGSQMRESKGPRKG